MVNVMKLVLGSLVGFRKLYKRIRIITVATRISKLKKIKKHEEVFILGSGASINNISNWDYVKERDSIGFNYFLLHAFVPSVFFLEADRLACNSHIYTEIIEKKLVEFSRTVFFVKKRQGFKPILHFLKTRKLKGFLFKGGNFEASNNKALGDMLEQYLNSRFMSNFAHYSQGVASVEQLVLFAIRMGYKKIYLCGVDLNNTSYFYDDEKYNQIRKKGLVPQSGQTGAIHKTNDKSSCWGGLTVAEVIKIYNDYFVKHGGKIYVCNPQSALAEFLPVFEL